MKAVLFSVFFMLSLSALAAPGRDSVAFFYRTDKVVVLINERGQAGRLQDFFAVLGASENFYVSNEDESMKFGCSRNFEGASCTFTFFPAPNLQIVERSLKGRAHLQDFGLSTDGPFSMYFESSMKDKFTLEIDAEGALFFSGSKLLARP